ncbi:MAG: substrate-binding domain-containing protein [Treponema sp.]|jgi:ribose transport system substrate-binding protein|nr:substrate-binding domain-containing protein [Treponema sp.]
MKNLLRAGIACFGLLALVSFLASLSMARSLYIQPLQNASLNYHFALYLPDNRNSFFTGIIAGAEQAAAEFNAAVSVHSIEPVKNELEMALYTGIDGAVVCPYLDDNLARRQLDRLGSRQIPTVIINHNIPNDQPWPFIGTNNFDVGRRLGLAAGGINEGPIRLAVVYSDKSPGFYGERELVEMGITAALGDRLAAPVAGFRTNLNPLDAEALLLRLFRGGSPGGGRGTADFNIIIFTDSNDTIAAAQTLIDLNMVGRVQIIGFGKDPAVQENIRKGIIACSLVINPERIGYEAVRSLAALRITGYTSTSIDTGIEIIDMPALQKADSGGQR